MIIEGKEFISSRRAAEIGKYSNDYIGQLCRSGKIAARMVGRSWYVDRLSLSNYISGNVEYPKNAWSVIYSDTATAPSKSTLAYSADDRPLLPVIEKKTPASLISASRDPKLLKSFSPQLALVTLAVVMFTAISSFAIVRPADTSKALGSMFNMSPQVASVSESMGSIAPSVTSFLKNLLGGGSS